MEVQQAAASSKISKEMMQEQFKRQVALYKAQMRLAERGFDCLECLDDPTRR